MCPPTQRQQVVGFLGRLQSAPSPKAACETSSIKVLRVLYGILEHQLQDSALHQSTFVVAINEVNRK